MPMVTKKLSVFPAIEGLNTASVDGTAPKGGIFESDNVIIHTRYGKLTRDGITQYSTRGIEDLETCQHARQFWRASAAGKVSKCIACGGGKVFGETGGEGVFTNVTGSAGYDTSSTFYSFTYSSVQIICNNQDAPYYWTGTGDISVLPGVIPSEAEFGGIFKRYTLLSGNRVAPDRVYRSTNPDDPSSGFGNYLDIAGGDQDPGGNRAIFDELDDTVIIAKTNSLYMAYSTGDYIFPIGYKPIDASHGCTGPAAWASVPGDIVYASNVGIHSLRATMQNDTVSNYLSAPIHNYWTENIDRGEPVEVVYSPENNIVYVKCIHMDSTTVILGFNLDLKQWFMWQDMNIASIFNFYSTDPYTRTLGTLSKDSRIGYLNKTSYYTDYGNPYSCEFTTGLIVPSRMDILHSFNSITLCILPLVDAEDIKFTYWVDGDEIETLDVTIQDSKRSWIGRSFIGTAIIGRGQYGWDKIHLPIKGTGTGIRFKIFTEGIKRSAFGFLGYVLEYEVDGEDLKSSEIT